MKRSVQDELYARAIGWEILNYLRGEHSMELWGEMEQDALQILEKIKHILDDPRLNDGDCYEKIEQIVQTFYAFGISTSRHD